MVGGLAQLVAGGRVPHTDGAVAPAVTSRAPSGLNAAAYTVPV
jgi:hypothetical protein